MHILCIHCEAYKGPVIGIVFPSHDIIMYSVVSQVSTISLSQSVLYGLCFISLGGTCISVYLISSSVRQLN